MIKLAEALYKVGLAIVWREYIRLAMSVAGCSRPAWSSRAPMSCCRCRLTAANWRGLHARIGRGFRVFVQPRHIEDRVPAHRPFRKVCEFVNAALTALPESHPLQW